MRVIPQSYRITDFINWHERNELSVQPKFQRRSVWTENARSYLIDTILKGLPIPKIFIREHIDVSKKTTVREIVDGQQRITAILDFGSNRLRIKKGHNQEFAGMTFENLPDEAKRNFLDYQISTDILVGASNSDVLDIFSRINSYTLPVNQQEKLNAVYVGPLKQLIYKLAHQYYEFWSQNKILDQRTIARMGDAQLVSELFIAMSNGLQSGRKHIEAFYKEHEDAFPYEKLFETQFQDLMDLIVSIFGDRLSDSPFSREPLFYSLFLALYDVIYGLKLKNKAPLVRIGRDEQENIFRNLSQLGDQLSSGKPSRELKPLFEAAARRTTNLKERQTRHRFFKRAIQSALS